MTESVEIVRTAPAYKRPLSRGTVRIPTRGAISMRELRIIPRRVDKRATARCRVNTSLLKTYQRLLRASQRVSSIAGVSRISTAAANRHTKFNKIMEYKDMNAERKKSHVLSRMHRATLSEGTIPLRREYSTYARGRRSPNPNYDPPVSGREWWRVTLKDTPIPGRYDHRDFLEEKELNTIKPRYNFKGEGRKKKPGLIRDGGTLLPGAYDYQDFIYNIEKLPLTYTFKDSGRTRDLPGLRDKDVTAAPCQYETASKPVKKMPSWHGSFRSQSHRFPTKYFVPKTGPPPGYYDPENLETKRAISSSFVSRTPRFSTSQTKVPGPGSYAATYQTPQASTLIKMGRMHGLFFRNAFEL